MEDSCNWDIEVRPLKKANSSTIGESSHLKTVAVASIIPVSGCVVPSEKSSKTSRSNVKKPSKTKQILQLPTEKLKPNFLKNESTEEIPMKATTDVDAAHTQEKKLACTARKGMPVEKYWETARNKEPLLNPLPKILSLASFKRQSDLTLTFDELVDDYDAFIKGGLDKHVEIIRVYTGPGESGCEDIEMKTDVIMSKNDDSAREHNDNPDKEQRDIPDREQNDSNGKRNGNAEMDESDETHSERNASPNRGTTVDSQREKNDCAWLGRSGSIANSSLRATYGSKSDLESLSSRSSSSREDSEQCMDMGTLDTVEQELHRQAMNFARGKKESVSSATEDHVPQERHLETHVGHFSNGLERDRVTRRTAKASEFREKHVNLKAKRSKNSQSKHSSKKGFAKEKEVPATLEHRNPAVTTFDRQGYEEYWKTYYQAWQDYYSATSNPYYRNFSRRSSWMAAYHMHSVYLQELLKP